MKGKDHEHGISLSEETERNIDFLYHSTADHVDKIAEQAGDKNLVPVIAARLVRLLEAKALWQTFRSTQSLPEMRQDRNGNRAAGSAGNSAWFSQEANLSRHSSGGRTLSLEARERIREAQLERWAKFRREGKRVKGSAQYEAQRAAAKAHKDRRGSPEAKEKQRRSMQKYYRDPKWHKAMLKRMKAMRARKDGKPRKAMSEEQRAKISAARKAYWAARKGDAA